MWKWLNYLINGLQMCKNDLEIGDIAKIFGKWLGYMGYGFSI